MQHDGMSIEALDRFIDQVMAPETEGRLDAPVQEATLVSALAASFQSVAPDALATNRARARLMAEAASLDIDDDAAADTGTSLWTKLFGAAPRWAMATAATVVVVTAGLLTVWDQSSRSLPGDPLYAVKRTVEEITVQVQQADPVDEQLSLAQARQEEIRVALMVADHTAASEAISALAVHLAETADAVTALGVAGAAGHEDLAQAAANAMAQIEDVVAWLPQSERNAAEAVVADLGATYAEAIESAAPAAGDARDGSGTLTIPSAGGAVSVSVFAVGQTGGQWVEAGLDSTADAGREVPVGIYTRVRVTDRTTGETAETARPFVVRPGQTVEIAVPALNDDVPTGPTVDAAPSAPPTVIDVTSGARPVSRGAPSGESPSGTTRGSDGAKGEPRATAATPDDAGEGHAGARPGDTAVVDTPAAETPASAPGSHDDEPRAVASTDDDHEDRSHEGGKESAESEAHDEGSTSKGAVITVSESSSVPAASPPGGSKDQAHGKGRGEDPDGGDSEGAGSGEAESQPASQPTDESLPELGPETGDDAKPGRGSHSRGKGPDKGPDSEESAPADEPLQEEHGDGGEKNDGAEAAEGSTDAEEPEAEDQPEPSTADEESSPADEPLAEKRGKGHAKQDDDDEASEAPEIEAAPEPTTDDPAPADEPLTEERGKGSGKDDDEAPEATQPDSELTPEDSAPADTPLAEDRGKSNGKDDDEAPEAPEAEDQPESEPVIEEPAPADESLAQKPGKGHGKPDETAHAAEQPEAEDQPENEPATEEIAHADEPLAQKPGKGHGKPDEAAPETGDQPEPETEAPEADDAPLSTKGGKKDAKSGKGKNRS